jgi:hypothetical protein
MSINEQPYRVPTSSRSNHVSTNRRHLGSRTRGRSRDRVSKARRHCCDHKADLPIYTSSYTTIFSRAFSKTHNIALLSRNPATLSKTQSSLPSTSTSHPFPADASDPASISSAWEAIKSHWPEGTIDVAIFNAPGGGFSPGGFLSKTTEDLERGLKAGV